MKVIKRDGSRVLFDRNKIINALILANNELMPKQRISNDEIESITNEIEDYCKSKKRSQSVEVIQDRIEIELMKLNAFELAKRYIEYRYEHKQLRDAYSTLMNGIETKLGAKDVQNQNANLDEHSFGGRIGEASSYVNKQFALNYCMSEMAKNNHLNNEIYIHDLDQYVIGSHNCLSIPFDKLLQGGFKTRQVDIRPAGSLSSALQLIAVIFQLQSLQQFGGVSATHLDWTLVPYVRKSFFKHYKDGINYLTHKRFKRLKLNNELSIDDRKYKKIKKVYNYALDMLKKECHQGVEALYHNLNSLQSRSGNQLPFTSINYGTCTLPEGRMVIEELLNVSIEGLGPNNQTSIFPCGIFQYMKGVNDKPGTPNYDLYRLALKSTSLRLYPNYANVDWTGNSGYDRNDPKTYFSTMGALAGHEHLYVKINDGQPQDISIKELFELCKNNATIKGRPMQLYYNKSELPYIESNWKRYVKLNDIDHIKNEAGVYKITYKPEDVSYIGSTKNIKQRFREHMKKIRHYGGLDGGVNFKDTDVNNYIFEVLEYTDDYANAEDKYIQSIPNVNFRGIAKKYYKNVGLTHSKGSDTRVNLEMNPNIPQDFIDLNSCDIKVLDRGNKWVKVKHIFKNDKYNTPCMMHIVYKEYDKIYTLSCTEDHPLWTGEKFVKACELTTNDFLYRGDCLKLPIILVKYSYNRVDSYDIGTETGSFIGSDIIMHNCRTANGYDINAEDGVNPQTKDGRGNICPTSIILPTLAMEAGRDVEKFMKLLDIKIHEAKDMLIERFNYICSQSPKSASFMYDNGTMLGYHKEEGIISALKHGTLAIGQLGLAETLELLVGCNQCHPKGMELAKRIEQLFKDRCAEFKQEYKLNFGVYYTPAENLCFTAMNKFKDKYGEIPNVSDKEFFTNSMHVPVWEKITAFEKIDIESQLTGYSSAGCITYVELDGNTVNNIDALEKIVNYAMDKDIPYFAINVPVDQCKDCGYQGVINENCPKCNSSNIKRLRRVTGYLTGDYKSAFNKGKQKETEQRVKHTSVEVE